jgi:hypothetical protein
MRFKGDVLGFCFMDFNGHLYKSQVRSAKQQFLKIQWGFTKHKWPVVRFDMLQLYGQRQKMQYIIINSCTVSG